MRTTSNRDLSAGLEEIGLAQFDRVAAGLAGEPDRDTGTHEARKALKRLRALLRLARPHLPRERSKALDRGLRDIGRALAPLRDARVSIDTLASLAPGACPTLSERLATRHAEAAAAILDEPGALPGLASSAGRMGMEWAVLFGEAVVPDVAGLERIHRRAGKRFRRAAERGSDEDFHEWRKEVKHLRYQLEALRDLGGEGLGDAVGALDELGELLGDEHDLTVLAGLVAAERDCGGEREGLLELLEDRRSGLRESALRMGLVPEAADAVRTLAGVGGAIG